MRHLRRTVIAAAAAALCAAPLFAAPVAAADGSREHGRDAVVVPVHKVAGIPTGEFLGERWAEDYEAHAGDTPPPPDLCATVGRRHKALVMGPTGETTTCSVARRTQLVVFGLGSACSDVEPDPLFGADEAAQRRCATEGDYKFVKKLRVSVDGLPPVDIRTARFEVVTPQMTAELPPDNVFGIPAQTATLVAHAWMAQVRELRPGQHTISVDAVTTEFAITSTFILNVGRGGHSNGEGGDDQRR
jgi:hypothetical protein